MRIKTYFAGTVEAALGLASRELGGDALLLSARPANAATRHLGAYEVVFGVASTIAAPLSLRDFLADQDCHPRLAGEVIRSLEDREASDSEVWAALREAVSFAPWISAHSSRFAFVGPPGAGKTSTTLKFAIQSDKPVQIFDGDGAKLGAPLLRAATLAGFACEAIQPDELATRAEKHASFLLDLNGTPDQAWAEALEQSPDVNVILVLPATWRTADLVAAADRYRAFRPSRLIFTRLDETSRAGGILSAAAITGLPLFAFAHSPGLAGGLEPSGETRLQNLLFQSRSTEERSAAAGVNR